ncbi:hypothetical protein CRUP_005696 [Coryphaenoides rupestris]|nr:hypothetical protein CRUP_005696 [Coryphaenoides rupestris]
MHISTETPVSYCIAESVNMDALVILGLWLTLLYLLSSPDLLYVATATHLSVTILTESPVTVTTRLSHGSVNLSDTTVDGEWLSPSGLVELTLSGHQGGQLIFSNSTWLPVSHRSVSSSVQTDRARYRPDQTVWVRDPSGSVAQRWDSQGSYLGIVSEEFLLPQSSALGQWTVVTTIHDLTNKKVFTVENSDPPPFDVLLTTAPRVLVGEDISGTVRAQSVAHGFFILGHFVDGQYMIESSALFFFSKDLLASLYEPDDGDITLNITASVTEDSTGFNVKRVVAVDALQNVFQLQFRDFPPVLKPSLSFSAKLEISRYDRRPLSPVNLNALVVVIQKTPGAVDQTETTIRPVGKEGYVLIQLTLQAQVQELIIHATFRTSKKTLKLSSEFPSISSYVQIQSRSDLQAQVSSRGQVLTAGTVCVTVYCVLPDGEVASDMLLVPIQQPNHVSLKWSEDWVKPGDQVSLTVTVRDPSSRVLLLVTSGTAEAQLPLADWLSNRETVCSAAMRSDGRPLGPGSAEENSFQEVDQGYPITWLYLDINVSDLTWVSPSFTVPHGVSSWRAEALVMSGERGMGFSLSPGAVPQRLSVSQGDLTLSMDVPKSVVIVLVEQSEAFEFVLSVEGDISVVNVRKVTVGRQSSVAVLFPVRPLALGLMEVTAAVLSAESSEILVQTVLVKSEGVQRFFSQTLFIALVGLAPDTNQGSRATSFSFPRSRGSMWQWLVCGARNRPPPAPAAHPPPLPQFRCPLAVPLQRAVPC